MISHYNMIMIIIAICILFGPLVWDATSGVGGRNRESSGLDPSGSSIDV